MPKSTLEKELDMLDDEYEEVVDDSAKDKDEEIDADADAKDAKAEEDPNKEAEAEADGASGKDLKDAESEGGSNDEETESKEDDGGEAESKKKDEADTTDKESMGESEKGIKEPEGVAENARINALLLEIDRLSGLIKPTVVAPKKETEVVAKAPEVETIVEKASTAEIDFVGDLDMDDVASDSSILNKILNKVMEQGISVGKKLNKGYLDTSMSQVIADQVSRFSQNQTMIDQFYRDNAELVNVKQVVKACAVQVASDNPDKGLEDILKMAAENTRKTLGIEKASSSSKSSVNPVKAAFVSQKGGQRDVHKKVSKLQQEIDEL